MRVETIDLSLRTREGNFRPAATLARVYLPREFEKALVRLKTPRVTTPRKPFVTSEDNVRRYGFALPKSLVALMKLADTWLIEDAKTKSFRYLRVAPGGWDLPLPVANEAYAVTVVKRFQWNTFSNMQLWEHFAGTMSLGWDAGDNRYMVSTQSPEAPVFWMDHETAEMTNAIARSLENFLRVQVGDDARVPKIERTLVAAPSVWDREKDDANYIEATVPLTSWPPFLSARADWLVGCLAFGEPQRLGRPEAFAFDFAKELPLVATREPIALYWMLRAYFFEERDVFDEAAPRARKISPLAKSFADLLEERWSASPKTSSLAKVRASLKKRKDLPRKAKWKSVSRASLT